MERGEDGQTSGWCGREDHKAQTLREGLVLLCSALMCQWVMVESSYIAEVEGLLVLRQTSNGGETKRLVGILREQTIEKQMNQWKGLNHTLSRMLCKQQMNFL